jgi:hypothetical protein
MSCLIVVVETKGMAELVAKIPVKSPSQAIPKQRVGFGSAAASFIDVRRLVIFVFPDQKDVVIRGKSDTGGRCRPGQFSENGAIRSRR